MQGKELAPGLQQGQEQGPTPRLVHRAGRRVSGRMAGGTEVITAAELLTVGTPRSVRSEILPGVLAEHVRASRRFHVVLQPLSRGAFTNARRRHGWSSPLWLGG